MPTFTAIALDSLLERGSRNPNPKPPSGPGRLYPPPVSNSEKKILPSWPHHAVSPTLYATPDVTPLPDSPSSFPPSPYIINHKRRGPRLLKSLSQDSVIVDESQITDLDLKVGATNANSKVDGESNGKNFEDVADSENGVVGKEETGKSVTLEAQRGIELDEFLDFKESMCMASNSEIDERSGKLSTIGGEFYDALDEISSDSGRSSFQNFEDELREMRLNLLIEIEKRKQAEEAVENLQTQWQSLSHHLSRVGLALPALPAVTQQSSEHANLDPVEDLCQQVVIARAVASSIGRACSRAEVEMEMEPQIESKNFEIARLWDRLQYYEAANREMSQRNQEAVEMARQQRHLRKRRQKWIWSSIGLAVTLGAAAIAWSYVPTSKPSPQEGETATGHGD